MRKEHRFNKAAKVGKLAEVTLSGDLIRGILSGTGD
jgi:hypothetical protein